MRWLSIRGHDGDVSRSMVALAISLTAALALGLWTWVPPLLRQDIGMTPVTPSRLTVDPAATGTATLGGGYTVGLNQSGFRYAKDDLPMLDLVTRGSPVVALLGQVSGATTSSPREEIDAVLDRSHFTDLAVTREEAVWIGVVEGEVDGRRVSLPLRWQVHLVGDTIETLLTVPGSDAVLLPADWRTSVTGIAPALPARNLRLRAWWFAPGLGEEAAYEWVLGTIVGLGPPSAARGIDLRGDGRIDLHVWSPAVRLRVTGLPRAAGR